MLNDIAVLCTNAIQGASVTCNIQHARLVGTQFPVVPKFSG